MRNTSPGIGNLSGLLPVAAAVCGLALLGVTPAFGQSQTAQSAMVNINLSSTAYQIEGTITWKYDRDAAETFYTNALDASITVVTTTGTGTTQTSPGAPVPDGNKLMQHAQSQRCIFFHGGTLGCDTYTQTVHGTRGWKWTYAYKISPKQPTVVAKTSWTSEVTGGGAVNLDLDGFVSSESYLKQANNRTKYSFTLIEVDAYGVVTSRVQNVAIQLEKFDGTNWNPVGLPATYSSLPVTATQADYLYHGNGGVFGNSTVYSALHAPGRKPAANVSAILLEDNFANNNGDLASGNVHQANFCAIFDGLTEAGQYRVSVSGTIKGNAATAGFSFDVVSSLIEIGGCPPPN